MDPRRIVGIYVVVAVTWIAFSDLALIRLLPAQSYLLPTSIAKGLLFVLVTGGLLYVLISRAADADRRARRRIEESEGRLALAVDGSQGGVWSIEFDPADARHLPDAMYLAPRLKGFIGFDAGEFPDSLSAWQQRINEHDLEMLLQSAREHLRGRRDTHEAEYRIRHRDGTWRWIYSRGRILRDDRGRPLRWSGIDWDITDLKESRSWLEYIAKHDVLTGLPNRPRLEELLRTALDHVRRDGRHVGVLYVDVDRFKAINETYGHLAGDAAIQAVAGRLATILRPTDYVARQAGDELIVLLDHLAQADDAARVAEKIQHAFGRPLPINSHSIPLSVSIGISVAPDDSDSPEDLLRFAAAAMQEAKDEGRGTYRFYTRELHARVQRRREVQRDLEHAVEKDELVLYYQPKVEAASGRVTGFEALLRWRHPQWGMVPPGDFLPVAESTGQMISIGRWVLHEAMMQAQAWQEAYGDGLTVAVNVAGPQIQHDHISRLLDSLARESNADPSRIELEITENFLMADVAATREEIDRLRALGFRLAIDDFGTGYSSLAYLARLPVQRLKIDQSFTRDVPASPENCAITNIIVELGNSFDLEITAEGVETGEQADYLRGIGCAELQGFYFARPMPAEDAGRLIGKTLPA